MLTANVLWAHERVNLTPPPELFDGWAMKKLGLVGVQSYLSGSSSTTSYSDYDNDVVLYNDEIGGYNGVDEYDDGYEYVDPYNLF